eukprot:1155248-Amphidinium_carterae.2
MPTVCAVLASQMLATKPAPHKHKHSDKPTRKTSQANTRTPPTPTHTPIHQSNKVTSNIDPRLTVIYLSVLFVRSKPVHLSNFAAVLAIVRNNEGTHERASEAQVKCVLTTCT